MKPVVTVFMKHTYNTLSPNYPNCMDHLVKV